MLNYDVSVGLSVVAPVVSLEVAWGLSRVWIGECGMEDVDDTDLTFDSLTRCQWSSTLSGDFDSAHSP